MKKNKVFMLLLAVLATALLFTSCALGWEDVLITVAPEESASYQAAEKLNDLFDAEKQGECEELVYLISYTDTGKQKHIVYNLDLGRVVYFRVESDAIDVNVKLEYAYENPVILESATTTALETGASFTTTTLYKANGISVVATMNAQPVFELVCDLILFDGKYYRVDAQGGISFAFDCAPGTALPKIFAMSDTYYYAENGAACTVYTRDGLQLVGYFAFPSYAENTSFVILSDGNLLVQYMIAELEHAEDYTAIFEGKKVTLVTQIFDVEQGETQDVKADYLLQGGTSVAVSADEWEKNGMDKEELPNFAFAWRIDGLRVNTEESLLQLVALNEKGEIEDVLTVEGQNVRSITMIGENRWILRTVLDLEYLVDQEGTVLGEVSNAELFEDRFFVNGRIYDLSMQLIYDYGKDGSTLLKKMKHGVLLKNYNGDILCYAKDAATKVANAADSNFSFYDAQQGYYVVRDASAPDAVKYEVYNDVGAKIAVLDGVADVEFVASSEKASLICGYNSENRKVYYRLG